MLLPNVSKDKTCIFYKFKQLYARLVTATAGRSYLAAHLYLAVGRIYSVIFSN